MAHRAGRRDHDHLPGGNKAGARWQPLILPLDSTLDSIGMRRHARYLYVHHGTCEHYVYMTNMRLYNPRFHGSRLSAYPRITLQQQPIHRVCDACKALNAGVICYGDRLSRRNPSVYCEHCHHALHYDSQGRLLYGDYLVFPYLYELP